MCSDKARIAPIKIKPENRVKIPPDLLIDVLEKAPRSHTLGSRGSEGAQYAGVDVTYKRSTNIYHQRP